NSAYDTDTITDQNKIPPNFTFLPLDINRDFHSPDTFVRHFCSTGFPVQFATIPYSSLIVRVGFIASKFIAVSAGAFAIRFAPRNAPKNTPDWVGHKTNREKQAFSRLKSTELATGVSSSSTRSKLIKIRHRSHAKESKCSYSCQAPGAVRKQ
ncbi:unnamed protein product, partial [Tuber aestivum]